MRIRTSHTYLLSAGTAVSLLPVHLSIVIPPAFSDAFVVCRSEAIFFGNVIESQIHHFAVGDSRVVFH